MDDRLRELERAARADPASGEAARAYARGLDLAGDPVGAWRELCRAARAGDAQAWAELEALPAGARVPGEVARRELVLTDPLAASVSGATFVIAQRHELLALDARDLSTRWVAGGCASALAFGPLVLHADDAARAIVVRDARSGREVGRAPLDRDLVVSGIAAAGDRALVRCERGTTSAAVSLVLDLAHLTIGSDGRDARPAGPAVGALLARHEPEPTVHGVARDRRFVGGGGVLVARGLVDDAPVRAFPDRTEWLADEGGEVLLRTRHGPVSLVDASSGRAAWSFDVGVEAVDGAALTADSAVLLGRDELVGRSRRTGARRWTQPITEDAAFGLAGSADVVYMSSSPRVARGLDDATRVRAYEADTGRFLWTRQLPHPHDPEAGRAVTTRIWACAGGIIVVAWGAGRVRIARF